MQSNRLILWSSLAALVLCAVPYGCAGKSISSSTDQEGTSQHPTVGEGRNQITDGASFGDAVYQGDGGVRYADGGFIATDGSRFIQGDGIGYQEGECCADGWINEADGANLGEGFYDRGDGQAPADNPDGNADGHF